MGVWEKPPTTTSSIPTKPFPKLQQQNMTLDKFELNKKNGFR